MWLLKYYINKVILEKYDGALDTLEQELLNDQSFIEANLFNETKSLYLSKRQKAFIDLCDKEKDEKGMYVDECMLVSKRFLLANGQNNRYRLRIRNYYDFNEDGIIYISSSRIVDMEVM